MELKKLLVLFKTHLDIGFTDFSANVVAQYMDSFIPNAVRTAQELREKGSDARLVWTTGSWLIHEYLRTHPGTEGDSVRRAIKYGDICWHGLPFTTHTELMNAELFRYGLSLGKDLDAEFEKNTIAAKMTDVPGHTKAIIPYMKENGIEFLHIGVNPASMIPDVPPLFRWQADNGDMINVMYQKDYGEFARIGESDTAVYFAHTGDNIGVQSAEAVEEIFDSLKKQLPGVEIVAATLNDLALAVRAIEDTLPVITDEIGDTWIHGVGTDPKKVSQFRALERLYESCCDQKDKEILARGLVMIPEHTWGMDIKTHLADHDHYEKKAFSGVCNVLDNYLKVDKSWQEQRTYLTDAVQQLSVSGQKQAEACLAEASRPKASVDGMTKYRTEESVSLGDYSIRFDEKGRIDFLRKADRVIADAGHRILHLCYEQFSWADYERFYSQYIRQDFEWAREDFRKPGMEEAAKEHYFFEPCSAEIFYDEQRIVVKYAFDPAASVKCGCPNQMDLIITAEDEKLKFDLAWFEKSANRIAEALWIGFEPIAERKKISKLATLIDPQKVVKKGQSCLHATDYGVVYNELKIRTLDAALVAPQEPMLLNFCDHKPEDSKVYFNLYNNIWGTNFPMWYDEDARFRFELEMK